MASKRDPTPDELINKLVQVFFDGKRPSDLSSYPSEHLNEIYSINIWKPFMKR